MPLSLISVPRRMNYLYHILGLEPVLGRTAAIKALGALGDDALQPELGRMLEDSAPSQSA
jgi:hypothetical protein